MTQAGRKRLVETTTESGECQTPERKDAAWARDAASPRCLAYIAPDIKHKAKNKVLPSPNMSYQF